MVATSVWIMALREFGVEELVPSLILIVSGGAFPPEGGGKGLSRCPEIDHPSHPPSFSFPPLDFVKFCEIKPFLPHNKIEVESPVFSVQVVTLQSPNFVWLV